MRNNLFNEIYINPDDFKVNQLNNSKSMTLDEKKFKFRDYEYLNMDDIIKEAIVYYQLDKDEDDFDKNVFTSTFVEINSLVL